MRRLGFHSTVPLLALAAMLPDAPRQSDHQRRVQSIVYRVVTLRESDAVIIDGPAGKVRIDLRAANMAEPTPAEADDFQERLEVALLEAEKHAAEASARAAGPKPHVSAAELDKMAATQGLSRREAKTWLEEQVGRPVTIGEAGPPARPPAGKQRKQPVRETRRQRARRQSRARR